MLATGGSAIKAIDVLMEHGVAEDHIVFLNIISCPEGIKAITDRCVGGCDTCTGRIILYLCRFSKVTVVTAEVDAFLNEKKYIVPGIGDFGLHAVHPSCMYYNRL